MPQSKTHSALLSRWLELTRRTLPAMARDHRWAIRLDHCFMRVCLDNAFGCRWDEAIARPAIRTMTEAQLAAAVQIAEAIARDPGLLPELNQASLRSRKAR